MHLRRSRQVPRRVTRGVSNLKTQGENGDAPRMRGCDFISLKKDEFLYLLKGAPAVPTARSNRCFAVATPLALRQQAVFSLPCLGGDHWLRTGRLLRLRVETASCPTVGSPSRSLGLAHYNRAPRLRGGYPSVAQLAQYTSAMFSCGAP